LKKVLVTGANGFIGKNLIVALLRQENVRVSGFDVQDDIPYLKEILKDADIIYHLAGVNRPGREEEFEEVNTGLTSQICAYLESISRRPLIILSSSVQAELNNPYGRSKKKAEDILAEFTSKMYAPVRAYRLPGVFGRWCRPNYNSVVATFCHNIARDLPVTISDPNREISLVHVGDVVSAFMNDLDCTPPESFSWGTVNPVFHVTLAGLAGTIQSFRNFRKTLLTPDMTNPFIHRLFGTYESYLPEDRFAYDLEQRPDNRGSLAELLKSPPFGQIFISRTKPGITRGNHSHDLKVEKFCVVEGKAIIRFRHILGKEVIEYPVSGEDFRVVDIPPGYTHSIENVGDGTLVTLFWAGEVFDPERPDTYFERVQGDEPR